MKGILPDKLIFLGLDVRNLWRNGGTILNIAAVESLTSDVVSLLSLPRLRICNCNQTNVIINKNRTVRKHDVPLRLITFRAVAMHVTRYAKIDLKQKKLN